MTPYDEFWKSPGVPREHQQRLWEYLRDANDERNAVIERAVAARTREQEISFNLLGDPDGSARPWHLDHLPLVMDESEFAQTAKGIAQRARLLNAILDDIYDQGRLISDGLLPAELVYGNPRYFRSVVGLSPLGGSRVVLYGADLGRNARGEFEVYSDRSSAPTGAGYALENRLVVGQVNSDLFRDYRVRKINTFFSLMHDTMQKHARDTAGAPRIVLLTPGVQDESSFEHAYLSRYLGFELVEGRDLTVRSEEVFLKTLEGLKKVDVILRRVADDWCDPLELREDSILGVSGLVAAARAGSVGIVNPLGSGLVESPAFKAYMEPLCQALLGESLLLPSIQTRWLGDTTHLQEVSSSFDKWVFKPAFKDRTSAVVDARQLSGEALADFKKKVLATPNRYVAEIWPERSTVPTGSRQEQAAPLSIRLFACRSGDNYQVMPGGLARLNDDPDGIFLTQADASVSKDLWVPAQAATEAPRLPAMPSQALVLRRGGVNLPSRLFDDIFWLGRYIERCDNIARLVRAGLEPITTESSDIPEELIQSLSKTVHALEIVGPTLGKRPSLEKLLLTAIYDSSKPNSIRSSLGRIRSLTQAVRSRLSRDAWDALRRVNTILSDEPQGPPSVDEALSEVQELIIILAAVHGIVGSNMVRGHAWMFIQMGRRVEHAIFVLTLLQHVFPQNGSHLMMDTLLSICDSTLTYRSRYLSTLQPAPVADLVLTDSTNPISVLFQVRRLLECIRQLPGEPRFPLSRAEQRLVTLETQLITSDISRACEDGAEALRGLAEQSINLLWQVSDDLSRTYFAHAGLAHAVEPSLWIDENLEAR